MVFGPPVNFDGNRPYSSRPSSVGHKWVRKAVRLPSEELEGNLRTHEDLLDYVRLQREERRQALKAQGYDDPQPPAACPTKAKFLAQACLPRIYAERWGQKLALQQQDLLRPAECEESIQTSSGQVVETCNACCVVESPTSLWVSLDGGRRQEKIPPRAWLLLEANPELEAKFAGLVQKDPLAEKSWDDASQAAASATRSIATESTSQLEQPGLCLDGLGVCQLSSHAGDSWLPEQDSIPLLRMVPESRLHAAAAEANFQRAAGGNSVTALRHAALMLEMLQGRARPGIDPINKQVRYAFPPASHFDSESAGLKLVTVTDEGVRALELPQPPRAKPPSSGRRSSNRSSPSRRARTTPRQMAPKPPESPPHWPQFAKGSVTSPGEVATESSSAASTTAPPTRSPASSSKMRGWLQDDQVSASPSPPAAHETNTNRPSTSCSSRASRVEALVSSRLAAAERCAVVSQSVRAKAFDPSCMAQLEDKVYGKMVLQKGWQALQEFLDFTSRRYGNPVRTWWFLDPEANMKIGERQFQRKLIEMGFRGNIPAFWSYLDGDGSGVVTLLELHPDSARHLASLKKLMRDKFQDSAEKLFEFLDDNRSHRVSKQTFVSRLKRYNFESQTAKLFDLLDRRGLGMLTLLDLKFFDTWRLPFYIFMEPDPKAYKAVYAKLMEVHQHPLKAWRKLDRDNTMKCSWDEFRQMCSELIWMAGAKAVNKNPHLPRTEADAAAAWRHIDQECKGWFCLRAFHEESHHELGKFKRWCDRVHGGVVKAFRSLDSGGAGGSNAKLSENELKRCTKHRDPCTANVEFIFDGLDHNSNWALAENDVKFLDNWDLAWEEWQWEAAASHAKKQREGED
eukprot:TRINITY_DN5591_c1_g1_i2.p1 TRINITY_DN5591_c1_g1~~TRINITY_DN5591_c1_g1_i2.p1  ORF type:complete len:854 (+),score=150.44 TRINITY_DN5591_c1_g1_i2:123-2684(+)